LTVVFIGAVRFHAWPPFRVLNNRPVAFIGVLSYSLYLMHNVLLVALNRVWKLPHAWQRGAVALGASMIRFYDSSLGDLPRRRDALRPFA
jgi:peptidoglycan/LPS O-acetylase OafA/YrhL